MGMPSHRPTRTIGRHRPIVTITVSTAVYEQIRALSASRGLSFSYTVEKVLTRQLDLPALPTP